MMLVHDYLRIRKAFSDVECGRSIRVTLSQLANVLFCTKRNVKIILKKMVERNWIVFIPGLGRGNSSEITFLLDYNETLIGEMKRRVLSGEIDAAFQFVKQYGDGMSFLQEEFLDYLSNYFGYSIEERHGNYLETLRLPVFREVTTLDPAESYYGLDTHIVDQVFDTLVEYNHETKHFEGSVSHCWKCDETATLWTFHLRKGVYFHLGRELEAEDVKFSLIRLSSPDFRQSWLAEDIESIHILSKYALQIKLKRPNHLFLNYLSYPPTSIVPREEYGCFKNGDDVIPIGTGAYRVTKHSAEIYVLEAFDHHFKGRAFIDRIEIAVLPDNESLSLKPASNLLLIHTDENQRDSIQVGHEWEQNVQVSGCSLLTLNQKKGGMMTNTDFRKALSHMINRRQMVQDLGRSRLYPANGFGFGESQAMEEFGDWNPEKVSHYLKNSMYAGEPISLFAYPRHAPDAYWLKEEFAKFGVHLDIAIVSWKEMLNRRNIELADMILFEIILSEGMIRLIENFKSNFIRSHLSDKLIAVVDRYLDEMLSQTDEQSQISCLMSIEKALKDDFALIFLVNKRMSSSSHPSLSDVKLNRCGWVDFKKLWFNPEFKLISPES